MTTDQQQVQSLTEQLREETRQRDEYVTKYRRARQAKNKALERLRKSVAAARFWRDCEELRRDERDEAERLLRPVRWLAGAIRFLRGGKE